MLYLGLDVGHKGGQVSVEEACGGDEGDGSGLLGCVDDALDELVGGARLGDLLQEGQGLVVEDEVLACPLSSKHLNDPAMARCCCVSCDLVCTCMAVVKRCFSVWPNHLSCQLPEEL